MIKALRVVFILWLSFITVRYGTTVLKSVAAPFNQGNDHQWMVYWLAAVSVIAALLLLSSRAVRILVTLTIVVLITIAILSGVWAAVVLDFWFLIVVYAWGTWLLKLARAEPADFVQSIATAVPLGLVVPATCGFALACVHLLKPAAIWILLSGLTVLQWRTILGLRYRTIDTHKVSFETAFPLMATLPVVVLNFIWTVAPEIQFDANNYHLAIPKADLALGGFVNQPFLLLSYLAHLNEMVYTFALAMHGQAAVKLLSFVFSLVAGCCAFSLGKEAFDVRVGCWAAAFFYTIPMVSWLAGTAYADNMVAMFLSATILAFVKWYKNPDAAGWLYITGALAGITISGKMNGSFGLPVIILAVLWSLRRVSLRRVAVFFILIAAIAAPWYAIPYLWTGNPVFPMLNGIFKSSMWQEKTYILNSTSFGVGTSPGALIRLPFRFTFNTDLFGEASPRGGAGIALLIALPFGVFLLSKQRLTSGVLVGTVAVYFAIWALTMQYCRYFAHILPALCVIAAATAFHLAPDGIAGRIRSICLCLALVMQFPGTSIQFWNIPERFPTQVALGLETREHFLDRALVGYRAVSHLNGVLKPQDRVIGAGVEQTRFYLNAPLESLGQSVLHAKLVEIIGAAPDQALLKNLRDYGFTYILATRESLRAAGGESPYLKDEFLTRFATIEFMDETTVLYRLNPL